MTKRSELGRYYFCPKHSYYVANSGRVWIKDYIHDKRRSELIRQIDVLPFNAWEYDGTDGRGTWAASDIASAERFEREDRENAALWPNAQITLEVHDYDC